MKSVTLKIEGIGLYTKYPGTNRMVRDHSFKAPWVAEIIGEDKKFKYKREFLKPLCDYSEANSKKTRGIYFYYHLFPNKIYHIYEHLTWKKERKYYAHIVNGELKEITEEEVEKWIKCI